MRSAFYGLLAVTITGCIAQDSRTMGIPAPSQQHPFGVGVSPASEGSGPTDGDAADKPRSQESESRVRMGESAPAQPERSSKEPDGPLIEKEENQEKEAHTSSAPMIATASLHFVSPLAAQNPNPVLLKVEAQGAVVRVQYQVDALWSSTVWTLGESTDTQSGFAYTYTFSEGGLRTIRALGFDAEQSLIADTSTQVWIQVDSSSKAPEPPPSPATSSACPAGEIQDCNGQCAPKTWLNDGTCDNGTGDTANFLCAALGMDGTDCGLASQSGCTAGEILDCLGNCAKASWIHDGFCDDGSQYSTVFTCVELGNDGTDCDADASAPVPYFYQYANQLAPGSSCQNTSTAMLLGYVGWEGTPDDITAAWGKDQGQSPAGLAAIFNHYAENMGISERLIPHTDGSISGLQALLSAGKPVIIHGYFTSYGHVLVVTGYNGTSYTVHDPAGQWTQQFKGGYSGWSSTAGKDVTYAKSAFELAVSSLNGSDYAPLWYHELTD